MRPSGPGGILRPAPDHCRSGATTRGVPRGKTARTVAHSPGDVMPSSLVTKIKGGFVLCIDTGAMIAGKGVLDKRLLCYKAAFSRLHTPSLNESA